MGCWGITAFESDAGLDAVDFIRNNLPEDGKLQVQRVLEELQQDDWNRPDNPKDGPSHTSPMALAEIMLKVMDNMPDGLDYVMNGRRGTGSSQPLLLLRQIKNLSYGCGIIYPTH